MEIWKGCLFKVVFLHSRAILLPHTNFSVSLRPWIISLEIERHKALLWRISPSPQPTKVLHGEVLAFRHTSIKRIFLPVVEHVELTRYV